MKKLPEANEFLVQPSIVSSVKDELRNKQHLFETSELDEVKRLIIPHHWLWRDLAQMIAFIYLKFAFFSKRSVLDTVKTPQIKLFSLFLRIIFGLIYQPVWNTKDRSFQKTFSKFFTEQELLLFLMKTENVHPKNLFWRNKKSNTFQIITEFIS